MKSILDPAFRYTPSSKTDLRKTFARIRRELRSSEHAQSAPAGTGNNVLALRQRPPAAAR